MTVDLQKVLELFGGTEWKPEIIEDSEPLDFEKPIKGGYQCRFVSLIRYQGESEKCRNGVYDFWSMKLQVVEDIEGDTSGNRFLDKTYNN